MSSIFIKQPNGYQESIQKGISGVQQFRGGLSYGSGEREDNIARLKAEIESAGAGAHVISITTGISPRRNLFTKICWCEG